MRQVLSERYELIEVVGEGGEGRVIKAIDRRHDRLVALKVRTATDEDDRDALVREAGVLLTVPPHPHLPLVREDFFEDDQYVIAMDWIEGTDLGQLLRARGRPGLAPSSVLHWLADTASALTHLHTLDPPVVHGDVKPANLVLTTGGRVVLVDFGLSSSPGTRQRRAGTPGFAAPELAAGDPPSRASDIYSLAATAFALLTGDAPAGVRPTWDGIDPAQAALLEEAVRSGLATDPDRRPATAGELVEALRLGWDSTLPTGVLTFCITDIEGSTPLWEEHPAEMATALVRHDQLIAEIVEAHGGRFLKAMGEGDSTTSVFPSARPGVDAMIDVQRALARNDGGGLALKVRAALHTGEAEQRDGAYYGTALHLTARVRGLADGGEVFLSNATAALVQRALPPGAELVDLGPHRLKGISEPEHVFALKAPGVHAPPPGTICPYPGLPAFEADDADRFFGRDQVVDELQGHLDDVGFVAIVGASGSGKSSVLRAGVAARTAGAEVLTPGDRPVPLTEGDHLVVVDQLEEAFSLCDDAERRAAFLDSIVDRAGPVAVGIRADFYGRCAEHARLAAAMAADQVLLGPLSPHELRAAIIGPAEVFGLHVEPALVDVLVEDVSGEPGALPLLSHALRATWERRHGRTLTLDAYRATGGLRAAIATTAEEVYGRLDPVDQGLTRRTFLALTEPGEGTEDTRRWATLAELTPPGGAERIESLLDAMAAERLVSRGEASVAVAHEALIREWPRLRGWLDEDREGLRLHRHLASAASAWDALGREPGELYRGPRLAAALDWAARTDDLSTLDGEFLDASRAEQEQAERTRARTTRRLRGLLAGVGVALVVALVAAVLALRQQDQADQARDRADVARVAAVSRNLVDTQPDVGLLLALAAQDLDDTAETRSTLLGALEAHPLLDGLIYGVDSGLEEAAFSPDGRLLATPTSDGTGTLLWDTATHERLATLDHDDDLALDAAISPDGRTLVVPAIEETADGPEGLLQVWDLETNTLAEVVPSPAGSLTTADFSADGRRLVTQGGPATDRAPIDVAVIWDTATWDPIGEPWVLDPGYSGDESMVTSPDGSLVAMPSPDGSFVGVWGVDERSPAMAPVALTDIDTDAHPPVRTMTFAPDGETLAVGTDSGEILFVAVASGRSARPPLRLPSTAATALEFSPDGAMLAVGRIDGRTQLYDVATDEPLGPPLAASSAEIYDVSFSPDGMLLATTSGDRTGALWRLDGSRAIGVALSGQDGPVTEAAYSSDGSTLLTAAVDGTVAVRDAGTGEVRQTVRVGGEVLSTAVAADRDRAAAGGSGDEVVLFDLDGGNRVDVPLDEGLAHQVAFTPDGERLAVAVEPTGEDEPESGLGSGRIEFIDSRTGEPSGPPLAVPEGPIGVGFSPDGTVMGVIVTNNLLHLYDAESQEELEPAIENVDAPITSFAFSPDGERLTIGVTNGAMRQYDADTHEPVGAVLEGEADSIFGLAYDPTGALLAGTSLGFSTTRLWDPVTGRPVGDVLTGGRVPYTYQTFLVDQLMWARPAFSPDGSHLVSPGFEGATVLWDLDHDTWRRAACELVGRELTEAEWQRYLPGREPEPLCPDEA